MSIPYHETKGRAFNALDNTSYSKDVRTINGALDAVVKWSGKSRVELAEMLQSEFVDFDDVDE